MRLFLKEDVSFLLLVSLLQSIGCTEADEQQCATGERGLVISATVLTGKCDHPVTGSAFVVIAIVIVTIAEVIGAALWASAEQTVSLGHASEGDSENDCDC